MCGSVNIIVCVCVWVHVCVCVFLRGGRRDNALVQKSVVTLDSWYPV